jgi:hypothetical protein
MGTLGAKHSLLNFPGEKMALTARTLASLAILTTLSVSVVGCDNKVAQCNKLIAVANKAATEMKAVEDTQDPAAAQDALTKISASLEGYSKEVQAIELKDEKLVGFRQRLISMYDKLSSSSKALVSAIKSEKAEEAETAMEGLAKGAEEETPLVNELNTYCGAK